MKIKPLKLNLQLFAENENQKNQENQPDNGTEPKVETVSLTPEELAKKIESEADRKLNSALKKKQDEWQKQLDEAIKKGKEEGKTYAEMTEEQRISAEFEKERKEFEEKRALFEKEKLTLDIQADLQKRELPLEFAETLVLLNDKEIISTAVVKIEERWNEAINQKVKEMLVQETPFAGGPVNKKAVNSFAEKRNMEKKKEVETPNPWA